MAQYRVGQRVRVVRVEAPFWQSYVGREGVIASIPGHERITGRERYHVAADIGGIILGFYNWELAPLTDPWAERKVRELVTSFDGVKLEPVESN